MHIPMKYYEAIVQGSVLRAVLCENCRTEFVYVVRRHGLGYGVSLLYLDNEGAQVRAHTQANADLQKELAHGQDAIPCPGCGWYQRSMIPLLQKAHRGGMLIAGMILVYIAAVFLALSIVHWFGGNPWDRDSPYLFARFAGWLMSIGLGLILIRKVLAQRIRPNEGDPEARIELGRKLALRKEDYEQALQAEEDTCLAKQAEPSAAPDPARM